MSGVATGSDTAPNRTLSRALTDFGVVGEGVVDDRVHVVKSHYPERRGYKPIVAKRAILLVRNPYDVVDSYFNMTLTNSHNTTMSDADYQRFAELFSGLARAEVKVWLKFNKWWLRAPIPLLVVRYEDLVLHRLKTLRRVAFFLNDCEPLTDTFWEAAAEETAGVDLADAGSYAPRKAGAGVAVGASLRRFSPELREELAQLAGPMLAEFGYDRHHGFPSTVAVAPIAIREPLPRGDACHETVAAGLVLNTGAEVRDAKSPFGRHMTTVRKQLTEPIVSDDGTELNMHEVIDARKRKEAENDNMPPGSQKEKEKQQQQRLPSGLA